MSLGDLFLHIFERLSVAAAVYEPGEEPSSTELVGLATYGVELATSASGSALEVFIYIAFSTHLRSRSTLLISLSQPVSPSLIFILSGDPAGYCPNSSSIRCASSLRVLTSSFTVVAKDSDALELDSVAFERGGTQQRAEIHCSQASPQQ